jgi:acyl carrier protein
MGSVTEKLNFVILQCAKLSQDIESIMFNDYTDLVDDLSFDSINIISLVIQLESEFNIQIPDDYLLYEELRNYSKLRDIVKKLISSTELSQKIQEEQVNG